MSTSLRSSHRLLPLVALATFSMFGQHSLGQSPLIGFTAKTSAPISSSISRQELCDPPRTLCSNVLPAPAAADVMAGGAAFDPRDRTVWHSQGTRIEQIAVDDNCRVLCAMPAALAFGIANSRVSGLSFDPARRALYQAETMPGFVGITTYAFGTAPCPTVRSQCRLPLPTAAHMAGGIAYDQARDLLYIATSVPNVTAPLNRVLIVRADSPCNLICQVPVPSCSPTGAILLAIQALAFDECRSELFLSDGRQTSRQLLTFVSPTAPCPTLTPRECCPLQSPNGEFWRGFDIESRRGVRQGFSCTDPVLCPNCPAMALTESGAAVIGNASYGFRIDGAPSGGNGWLLIGFGTCQPFPFFCGRIHPPLGSMLAVGPVPLGGAGACGGSASFGLPIPDDFGLCDFPLCVQGIVTCPFTNGIGLTNALSVSIGI